MNKQQEILKAALKLFVAYGFHGTATGKIAQEAGVATGTLFHYYKTKDDLIVALYVDIKTRLTACWQIGTAGNESIKDQFRQFYIAGMDWSLENNLEFKFTKQFLNSPYLLLLAPEEIQKQSRLILNMIKDGILTKTFKPLPEDLINTLLTSHLYGVHDYISNSKLSDSERKLLIDDSFEMIWKMISL
ncbi:DNA-binding transcriptional regulator, AcrR family [Pseudarcicella hirudinis]|uniref:DNA-binding transcriptional regulator, AcrR family n=1 Tax=Pseudarcicella hirudinis TaxID=1079859 RepID=A0A1I5MB19_9BACT|nr:TetR/AcrR family transcriptional regulator [Pseudarcicella hirudinis]SFP06136.1 DNA-binding transcriptional regulator, AcrR family [Pseudarcicella hirudinis]